MEHTNIPMLMLSITPVLLLLWHTKISAVKKVYLAYVHLMSTSCSTTNYLHNIILCNFRGSVQNRISQIWTLNICISHIRTLEILRELNRSFVVSEIWWKSKRSLEDIAVVWYPCNKDYFIKCNELLSSVFKLYYRSTHNWLHLQS